MHTSVPRCFTVKNITHMGYISLYNICVSISHSEHSHIHAHTHIVLDGRRRWEGGGGGGVAWRWTKRTTDRNYRKKTIVRQNFNSWNSRLVSWEKVSSETAFERRKGCTVSARVKQLIPNLRREAAETMLYLSYLLTSKLIVLYRKKTEGDCVNDIGPCM